MGQLLGQHDSDRSCVASINRDRERAGISIRTVDGAFGFPNAIGVSGRMIVVADKENLRPEVVLQAVLRFDRSEVIASRYDTPVENDQVVVSGGQDDGLLGPGGQGETGE